MKKVIFMSTSGNMSTSNQYVKYTISINQNSQNVSNNCSNVTVTVRFFRTNSGYVRPDRALLKVR